ncbi:MAG: hypothetical protein OXB96_02710 [Candidatus Kaiserbacteria bacterium]|nr:hypothetical protein [Candidatus Kaiserbacteria bacterium]
MKPEKFNSKEQKPPKKQEKINEISQKEKRYLSEKIAEIKEMGYSKLVITKNDENARPVKPDDADDLSAISIEDDCNNHESLTQFLTEFGSRYPESQLRSILESPGMVKKYNERNKYPPHEPKAMLFSSTAQATLWLVKE